MTSEFFMATYGDGVGDIDIDALGRLAVERGKIGTVTSVTPASRFGNIEVDDGKVTAFNEKPDAGGGSINGGFFVFKREFFDVLDKYGDVMLEREPMDDLVAARRTHGLPAPRILGADGYDARVPPAQPAMGERQGALEELVKRTPCRTDRG